MADKLKKSEKGKPKFPGNLNVNQIDNTYVKPSIVKELQNKSVASKTTMPTTNRFSNKFNINKIDNTYVAPTATKDLTVKTKASNSTVPVSNWPTNKNKNAVAEAVAKRKPIKKEKEKEKEEDNDSWLENVGEFVDPTGVSSYDDVYRAYKNTGLSGETALETFGALPLIGKIGKSGKVIAGGVGLLQDVVKGSKYLPAKTKQKVVDSAYDLYQSYAKNGGKELDDALGWSTKKLIDNIPYLNPDKWKSSTKAINAVNAGFKVGKVSDAIQAALGSKDDSGFTYNANDDNTLKYNGRNILPNSGASENMYANGGMIKRADGSYSQRGLWDNIRANKGSGKEPTKEMLKQERKINAKYAEGGKVPIVVNNLNDPRLRAYNDSLNLYNNYKSSDDLYKKVSKKYNLKTWKNNSAINRNAKIQPVSSQGFIFAQGDSEINGDDINDFLITNDNKEVLIPSNSPEINNIFKGSGRKYGANLHGYKKPVQQIIYQKFKAENKPKVKQEIKEEQQFEPDMVTTATPQAKTKLYQGYDFMQQTGLRPGDYTESQVQEAMKNKGLPKKSLGGYTMYGNGGINNPGFKALPENIQKKILAKMAMGGKVGYDEYVPEFVSKEKPLPKFYKGGVKPAGTWAGTDGSGKAIQTNFANSTAGSNVVTGAGIAGAAVPMLTSFIPDDKVTDSEGNEVGSKESMGKSILNSAAQGASMGSVAGPWGAAIGAGVGAIYGGVTNSMNNAAIDKAQNQANMRIENKNLSNKLLTNQNNYSVNRYNNDQMIAAKGGTVINKNMGNPNAELELNETFRDPMTGETGMVDGPSHDDGGIQMSLAEGTQIWSDRLKHNGRTFASLTKPIINKIANIEKGLNTNPNSRFKQNSIKLLNSQLDFFFDIQESNKQQDEMKRTLKKQEGGVVDDMGNYHYADGGIYIKPENRGKFTAYKERTGKTTEEALHSPNAHVRKMANFAKNAAGWKHAMGGTMQYPEGGISIGQINPSTGRAYTIEDVQAYNQGEDIRPHVPGQLSGDTYTGGNMNFGQANRNFALNNSSGEYGPLNNQSFNQPINRELANIPETIQGRQLPNYSLQSPTLNAYTNPKTASSSTFTPNFKMLETVGKPGGMINFNRGLPEPKLPQVYNSTPYIKARGNQNPYKGTDIAGNKTVDNNGNIVEEFTTNQSENAPQGWFRNNKGELIQAGALAGSAAMQLNNINKLAAPGIRSNVRLTGAIPNPRYVDLSAERGAINRSAMNAMGEASRGFGNSATAQAFKNKARINQLEGAGKSYLNQENINADIYNKFAGMRGEAAMKEALVNNEIENANLENRYKFNESRVGNRNAVIGDIGKGASDIGRNRTNYSNQLEMANIYGNAREGTVQNQMLGDTESARAMFNASTPAQKAAWNAERIKRNLVPFKYGGTVNRTLMNTYANGGTKTNKYRQELYSKAIGPDVQTDVNARQMDDEYSKALEGTADTYTSAVTGLDYKVIRSLPEGEKRLLAANMWKDLHGTAPTKAQEKATVKAIEGKKVSSSKAKEVVNQADPTFSRRDESDYLIEGANRSGLGFRNKNFDKNFEQIRNEGYDPYSERNFNTEKPEWITPEIEDLNTYKQQQESENIKEKKTIANLKRFNPAAADYYEKTGDLQGALDSYVAPDRFDPSSGSAGYSIGKAVTSGDMQGVDYLNAGMLLAGAFGARKGRAPSNSKQLNERNPRLSNVRSTPEERTIQGTKNWRYQTGQTPGLQEYYDKKAKMFKEVNPKVKYTDPIKQQGKLEPSKQKLLPGATKTSIDMEDEQFALDFNKRQNTKNNAKLDRKLKVAEGADKYTKRSLNSMNKRLDDMEVDSYGKIKETENTVKNMQKSEIFKIKDLERKMKLAKNQGDTKRYNKLYNEYLTVMELN